jgi:hypothetical protein
MIAAALLSGCATGAGQSAAPPLPERSGTAEAAVAYARAADPPLPAPEASLHHPAPEFLLDPVDGGARVSLADTLTASKGGPTVLVLGAASCSYSRDQLNALAAAHPGYRILAVVSGTAAEVRGSLPALVPFPVLVDPDGAVLDLYRVTATPSIVVLDGRGTIAYIGGGGCLAPEVVADMADRVARGEHVDGGSIKTQGG